MLDSTFKICKRMNDEQTVSSRRDKNYAFLSVELLRLYVQTHATTKQARGTIPGNLLVLVICENGGDEHGEKQIQEDDLLTITE